MPADFSPRDLTSNTSHSPFVASESSYYSTWQAWRAFNAASTYWMANATTGSITLDIGAGNLKILTSYDVKVGPTAARAPKAWTAQGSLNGSDWDTLDTVTAQTSWTYEQTRSFTCDVATTGYRYFRIDITENNGDASYVLLNELYLFGDDPPAGTPRSFGALIGS